MKPIAKIALLTLALLSLFLFPVTLGCTTGCDSSSSSKSSSDSSSKSSSDATGIGIGTGGDATSISKGGSAYIDQSSHVDQHITNINNNGAAGSGTGGEPLWKFSYVPPWFAKDGPEGFSWRAILVKNDTAYMLFYNGLCGDASYNGARFLADDVSDYKPGIGGFGTTLIPKDVGFNAPYQIGGFQRSFQIGTTNKVYEFKSRKMLTGKHVGFIGIKLSDIKNKQISLKSSYNMADSKNVDSIFFDGRSVEKSGVDNQWKYTNDTIDNYFLNDGNYDDEFIASGAPGI